MKLNQSVIQLDQPLANFWEAPELRHSTRRSTSMLDSAVSQASHFGCSIGAHFDPAPRQSQLQHVATVHSWWLLASHSFGSWTPYWSWAAPCPTSLVNSKTCLRSNHSSRYRTYSSHWTHHQANLSTHDSNHDYFHEDQPSYHSIPVPDSKPDSLSLLNPLLAIIIGHCRRFPLAFSTPAARVTKSKTTLSVGVPCTPFPCPLIPCILLSFHFLPLCVPFPGPLPW